MLQHCRTALPGLLQLLLIQAIPVQTTQTSPQGLYQPKPVPCLVSSAAPWILTLISCDEFLSNQELFQTPNTQITVHQEQGRERNMFLRNVS